MVEKHNPVYEHLLLIFIVVYPFLVVPFFSVYYSTFTKLIYLIGFVILIWVAVLVQSLFRRLKIHWLTSTAEKWVIVFLILVCVATYFSVNPKASIFGYEYKFIGLMSWVSFISLFLFAYHFIRIEKHLNFLNWIVWASVPVSLYGLFQHFKLDLLVDEPDQREFVQSWAFFDNPNHFGTYLLLIFLISALLFLIHERKIQIYTVAVINGLTFLTLLYSGSKAGWIGIFVGSLIFTIYIIKEHRKRLTRWVFLMATLLMLILFVNITESNFVVNQILGLSDDMNTIINEEDDDQAGSGRWGLWKRSIPIVQEHWLTGTGPSMFQTVYKMQTDDDFYTHLDNTHNEFLEIAVTTGIPTLLVYIIIIGIILKNGTFAIQHSKGQEKLISYGYFAIILSYLIKVMFNISVVPVAPLFFLLLGMSYKYFREVRTG